MLKVPLKGESFNRIWELTLGRKQNIPECWRQPIEFIGNTYRLKQEIAGPCGIFSCLQAFILLEKMHNPEATPTDLLIESVIHIMQKIRRAFAFCIEINPSELFCNFALFSIDQEQRFRDFLHKSACFTHHDAVFLLTLSFAFIAGPLILDDVAVTGSLIEDDDNSSMNLVRLLLTGRPCDSFLDNYSVNQWLIFEGIIAEPEVGFLSYEFPDMPLEIGTKMSHPLYSIWVIYTGGHFVVVQYRDGCFFLYDPFLKSKNECVQLDARFPLMSLLQKIASEAY